MASWGDFCTWCGAALPATDFPRTCPNQHVTYNNGLPVGVALQPVMHKNRLHVLAVKRGIPPYIGQYALPGGFKENHETFTQCAARELHEETGVVHGLFATNIFWQATGTLHGSGSDPRLPYLQFERMPQRDSTDIDLNFASAETQAIALITYDPDTARLCDMDGQEVILCFPLHQDAVLRFFQNNQ